MDNDKYELLCLIEQLYFQNGSIPTKEYLVNLGITAKFYDKCIKDKAFRDGLLERGIRLTSIEGVDLTDWRNFALTEEQLTVANVLLDLTDQRSRAKKLSELGISTAKYQAWLKDSAFQSYLRARAEGALDDNQHEAHLALIDRVVSGDVNAIKYFNELTGRYVQSKDSNLDVMSVLMRVVEIVQKHVKDPVALAAIGNELINLSDDLKGGTRKPSVSATPVKVISAIPVPQPVGNDV